ncbi:DUF724 domain-containing protein 7 [Vitis vinifera]|uniref:DUF724 domain-containing protein 7 n=1 Tax=Vitis vinifera TaxID=29760 RepID=A0A438IXY2_VITVI|nr:DUF724 domain-containing protein 7 [Vitis vinifera]
MENGAEIFRQGSLVEVRINNDGCRGSWYVAKIIMAEKSRALVEYQDLLDGKDGSRRLREVVDTLFLRPLPPLETNASFGEYDIVDTFYHDGWCTGVIICIKDSKYTVFFSNNEIQVDRSDLRLHKEWVNGKWVQPRKECSVLVRNIKWIFGVLEFSSVLFFLPGDFLWEGGALEKKLHLQIIEGKYGKEGVGWQPCEVKGGCRVGVWKGIKEGWDLFFNRIPFEVGNDRRGDTRGMKHWSLRFTRHFNDWELEIVETFFSMLRESLVKRDDSNKGVWKDDKKGLFSIKSFYEVLDVGGQSSFQRTLFGICGMSDPFFSESFALKLERLLCREEKEKGVRTTGLIFSPGAAVEVTLNEQSSRDAWFPAIVRREIGLGSYVVQCQSLKNSGEAGVLDVTVDNLHIRPSPPRLEGRKFGLLEKVDAFYDYGWWNGIVTKVLTGRRYVVFFKHTNMEKEFIHSDLRPHMEWVDGKWVGATQSLTNVFMPFSNYTWRNTLAMGLDIITLPFLSGMCMWHTSCIAL